jgi:hypothetical protein
MHRTILMLVALSLASCFKVGDPEARGGGSEGGGDLATLGKRASFDLSCPKQRLEFSELGRDDLDEVSQYGVTGCGQKVVYVRTSRGWVLNSDSHPAKGKAELGGRAGLTFLAE